MLLFGNFQDKEAVLIFIILFFLRGGVWGEAAAPSSSNLDFWSLCVYEAPVARTDCYKMKPLTMTRMHLLILLFSQTGLLSPLPCTPHWPLHVNSTHDRLCEPPDCPKRRGRLLIGYFEWINMNSISQLLQVSAAYALFWQWPPLATANYSLGTYTQKTIHTFFFFWNAGNQMHGPNKKTWAKLGIQDFKTMSQKW